MDTEFVMHGRWEDNYDDPAHPIPSVTALDVQAIRHGGGSDPLIVIASPLQADERSQRRLLEKIEMYLRYLSSGRKLIWGVYLRTSDNRFHPVMQ